MTSAPYGLALAAGILAAVNPCGFALLPAYLSFLILGDGSTSRATAVARALALTTAMTLGFVAVFGLFGLFIVPVADSVQQYLPWFTIVLGLGLLGVGGWLLAGKHLPGLRIGSRTQKSSTGKPITRSIPSTIAFGAAYAIASLGCTIGPFLAIVVASFQARSTLTGVGLFVAYALGMGLLVGVAALLTSLTRTALVGKLRRFTPVLTRAGGALLIAVGAYVAYYGSYEIRVLGGGEVEDPIVSVVERVQGGLSGLLDRLVDGLQD